MNALELRVGCQAGECAGEMRMPRARENVLPAIGFEQGLLDHANLEPGQLSPAGPGKVIAVSSGLPLHNPVDGADQLDQLADRDIACCTAGVGIDAAPLQLVHDGVLALLLPVEE